MSLGLKKIYGRRQPFYLPAKDFLSVKSGAPTISVVGNVGGTVYIGISKDDGTAAVLSKTTLTDRTGITGVQAPGLMAYGDVNWTAGLNPCNAGIDIYTLTSSAASTGGMRTAFPIPWNWNLSQELWFRILYACQDGAYDTTSLLTWFVTYQHLLIGTTFGVTPVALNTPIAAKAKVVGGLFQKTGWGKLKPKMLTHGNILHLCVGYTDAGTLNTNGKFFYGVEIGYVPDYRKDPA